MRYKKMCFVFIVYINVFFFRGDYETIFVVTFILLANFSVISKERLMCCGIIGWRV